MQDVNIYIETSNKGPVRRDGEYIYVLECLRDGEPVTRDGRGQLKNTTENQLTLQALLEALSRLRCPCELRIYTQCEYVANAIKNGWARQWQKNGWQTAKGKPVKDLKLWEKVMDQLDRHLYRLFGGCTEYSIWMADEMRRDKTRNNE